MDAFNPDILKTMQQAFELSKMFDATSQGTQGNAKDKAVGESDAAQSGADTENNMKQIIDMMNLVQSMKSITSPQNQPSEPSNGSPGNAFANAGSMYANSLRQFAHMPGASEFITPAGPAKNPYNFDNGFPSPQATGHHSGTQSTKPRGSKQNSPNEIHTPALESIKAAIPYLDERYRRYMNIFVKLIEIQKMMELYSQAAVSMCSGGSAAGNWHKNMLEAVKPHMDESKANMIDLLIKLIEMKEISGRMQSVMKG